jgi:nucleoside-diphosphate-sugar epimerase
VRRVLITGAAGKIGTILRESLEGSYDITGVDRRRSKRRAWRHVDLRKLRSVERVARGQDAIVDLAANPAVDMPWQEVYENNVRATWNVLAAAAAVRVERVVFASSNHVVGLYERDAPYADIVAGRTAGLDPDAVPRLTADVPIRPDGPYGVGKALGEAAARYFSETFGLSVLCLRIGTVNWSSRPESPRELATLLTHDDLVRLVRCCLEAPPELRFGAYYGVSRNTWRFWDLEAARRDLGYEPADDAETWRYAVHA